MGVAAGARVSGGEVVDVCRWVCRGRCMSECCGPSGGVGGGGCGGAVHTFVSAAAAAVVGLKAAARSHSPSLSAAKHLGHLATLQPAHVYTILPVSISAPQVRHAAIHDSVACCLPRMHVRCSGSCVPSAGSCCSRSRCGAGATTSVVAGSVPVAVAEDADAPAGCCWWCCGCSCCCFCCCCCCWL